MKKRIKKAKYTHPRHEKREYVVIAGSGPSVEGFTEHVDIATKKMSLPADYQFARHQAWYYKVLEAQRVAKRQGKECRFNTPRKGFMLYRAYETPGDKYPVEKIHNRFICDYKYWDSYFRSFNPRNQNKKPSVGLCAVMSAYERWAPDRIGLIGFDWVLDGFVSKDPNIWPHDSIAELKVMESLTEIIDLRDT
jgi:hypothetical protein